MYCLHFQISSADDNATSMRVAIKKLSMPFSTKVHAKRAYREIKLLKHVDHDNIIKLFDLFSPAETASYLDDM